MKQVLDNRGITLVGLMVTVILVVVLSTLVFLWIDPLEQSGTAKDSKRIQAVNILAAAIKDYSNNNKGALPVLGSVTTSSKKVLCTTQSGSNVTCGSSSELCLRIADQEFYDDYLFELPIDPDKTSEQDTGYYLQKSSSTGQLIVGACETYGSSAIIKRPGFVVSCDAYAGGYCWKIAGSVSQTCSSVCSGAGLTCVPSVSYATDSDCDLNLSLATSTSICDTSCASGTIVGNNPSATSCYYSTDSLGCSNSVTDYLNICPCE